MSTICVLRTHLTSWNVLECLHSKKVTLRNEDIPRHTEYFDIRFALSGLTSNHKAAPARIFKFGSGSKQKGLVDADNICQISLLILEQNSLEDTDNETDKNRMV